MIEEARKVIDNYFKAKEEGNFELLSRCFLQDENLLYIGSDRGEVWKGWKKVSKYLKAQFISFEKFKAERKRIFEKELEKDRVYLFVEENEVSVSFRDKTKSDVFIISIVVEKIEGEFKIIFLHRSLPAKEPSLPYSIGSVRFI